MSEVYVIKSTITAKTVFTCHVCGGHALGETQHLEFEDIPIDDIPDGIRAATRPQSTHMPVGWSSFWGAKADIFECSTCKAARS